MQISILVKAIFFLTLYAISDLHIKNHILKKAVQKANRARKV